jgi:hypothetical protein
MDRRSFERELGTNAGRETTELGQGGPISGFPAVTCSPKEARTPENHPKCIFPGPGKILRFRADVCANLGKFGLIFDQMYVSNPGNLPWLDKCMWRNPGAIRRP